LYGEKILTLNLTGSCPEKLFEPFLMSGKNVLTLPPHQLANIFGKNSGQKNKFAAGHHLFWQGNSGRFPRIKMG
jgi:hypothetical protein